MVKWLLVLLLGCAQSGFAASSGTWDFVFRGFHESVPGSSPTWAPHATLYGTFSGSDANDDGVLDRDELTGTFFVRYSGGVRFSAAREMPHQGLAFRYEVGRGLTFDFQLAYCVGEDMGCYDWESVRYMAAEGRTLAAIEQMRSFTAEGSDNLVSVVLRPVPEPAALDMWLMGLALLLLPLSRAKHLMRSATH